MSNAILAWSLVFMLCVAVPVLSDSDITTFPNVAATQKQENSTSVLTNDNNNNTITKTNNANNNLVNEGISLLIAARYNEAINLFDKVLAMDPTNTLALTNK